MILTNCLPKQLWAVYRYDYNQLAYWFKSFISPRKIRIYFCAEHSFIYLSCSEMKHRSAQNNQVLHIWARCLIFLASAPLYF